MLAGATGTNWKWLRTGRAIFADMMAAIDAARHSVCLETYTFSTGPLAERFREALVQAARRGVRVRVLVDALGSYGLPVAFWESLRAAGGEVRQFNPLALDRIGIRDHRKLLVCDAGVAFVGGFNIASEYEGDGVTLGWCDIGLKVEGPVVVELVTEFEEMFQRSEFKHKRFMHLRKSWAKRAVVVEKEQLLLSGPGRGRSPIKRALRADLADARDVRIMTAYFLPTWRIRRQLMRVARRGGRVWLLLAGKSDVLIAHLAGRSLYRRLLKAGVEIYEYQPQILHAKLVIIDGAVYVGSANLDQRSLNINYELMMRFDNAEMAGQAREIFGDNLKHCRRITLEEWGKARTLWGRLKQRWAYFFLMRVDPYIARRQWKEMAD